MSAYRNYLQKTNALFESLISEIDTVYNFDHGDEFEFVLCKALRRILPQQYGIVRGHIITKSGETEGDDIIIYDCVKFPSLRLLETDSFGQKQFIPVEAVYAYIEAKNTLYLTSSKGCTNFQTACEQVHRVKSLPREPVPVGKVREFWPSQANPIYGVVWAKLIAYSPSGQCKFEKRHKDRGESCCLTCTCLCVKDQQGHNPNCCAEELHEKFEDMCTWAGGRSDSFSPDLIVAGGDYVTIPCIRDKEVHSPFFIKDRTRLATVKGSKKAFGVAVTNLLWALDSIQLGNIDWGYVLGEELGDVTQPPSRQ